MAGGFGSCFLGAMVVTRDGLAVLPLLTLCARAGRARSLRRQQASQSVGSALAYEYRACVEQPPFVGNGRSAGVGPGQRGLSERSEVQSLEQVDPGQLPICTSGQTARDVWKQASGNTGVSPCHACMRSSESTSALLRAAPHVCASSDTRTYIWRAPGAWPRENDNSSAMSALSAPCP